MMSTRPGRSVFSMLLLVFVLVVLPIYFGGFLVYSWGVGQVKAEISRSSAARSQYYLESLQSDLKGIRNQASSLMGDRDVRLLAITGNNMAEIDRVFSIKQVQDQLRMLMVSHPHIADISLHMPGIERTIQAIGSITDLDAAAYQVLNETAGHSGGLITLIDEQPVLLMTYPQQYLEQNRLPVYLLEIRLSKDSLMRSLALLAENQSLGLFMGEENHLIAATSNSAGPAGFFLEKADGESSGFSSQLEYDGADYLVTIDHERTTDLTLVGFTAEQQIYEPLLRYQPLFWGFTGLVAILALLFFILLYQMLHRPLRQFVGAFRDLEEGRFNVRLDHRHRDEFHDLYSGFNAMADRLQHLVEEVFKKTIYAQQAELKQLQSQISPHFLYNSFFVLQNMADSGDVENLSDYAGLMGQYFQYITRNAQADATLAEEVEHARIYAILQTRRFRNRLSLEFGDLPPACRDCLIPRLILQPILENAFDHGLKNKLAGGLLQISFRTAENRLQIRIADNGESLDTERLNELNRLLQMKEDSIETTGLVNVHRRLQLRFGTGFGLKLEQTPGGGLTVDLTMPVRTASEKQMTT